jgi:hypothetical protein
MNISERMPWSRANAAGALLLLAVVFLAGFGLLMSGNSLGWLCLGLGVWFTVGMVSTALGAGGEVP